MAKGARGAPAGSTVVATRDRWAFSREMTSASCIMTLLTSEARFSMVEEAEDAGATSEAGEDEAAWDLMHRCEDRP